MALLNYKGKNSGTYQGVNETPLPVSIVQYILHYAYGVSEPTIMRLSASVLQSYKNADNQAKKKILEKLLKTLENTSDTGIKFMPHGIVLGRKAAENVIDFVYFVEGFRGGRLAVGPCICELANKKYPPGVTAPEYKDITLYYASDIYTNLPPRAQGHHRRGGKGDNGGDAPPRLPAPCVLYVRQEIRRIRHVQLRQGHLHARQRDACSGRGAQLLQGS